ncbi:MAG: ABC transporter permease [Kiritimatiellaeota bacterium]|nr:ABC transporter permease [Kiritimatiellota bacterium]
MRGPLRNIAAIASTAVLELYRRRDVYTAVVLAIVVTVPLASVNVFGVKGIVRYLREITLLLVWLFTLVIGLTTAARQIPRELENRTIYALLAKPLRRSEFILGKFAGAVAATGLAVLLFYLCYVVLDGLKEGVWYTPVLPQVVLLHLALVALMTALVIFGSTFLTPSANVTCSALIVAGMLLFGQKIPEAAARAVAPASWILWTAHAVLPHFEFFDLRLRLVHGWEPISPAVLLAVLGYCTLYTTALLGGAVAIFSRKRL